MSSNTDTYKPEVMSAAIAHGASMINDIYAEMIDRYGDFVHYQPPVNRVTVWLWLAPGLLLISLLLVQLKRRANPQSYPPHSDTDSDTTWLSTALRHRVRVLWVTFLLIVNCIFILLDLRWLPYSFLLAL